MGRKLLNVSFSVTDLAITDLATGHYSGVLRRRRSSVLHVLTPPPESGRIDREDIVSDGIYSGTAVRIGPDAAAILRVISRELSA